ncbi:hypothetical protein C9J01_27680 [Photobacterium rosenbergii]|uniref:DNA primase/helicase Gp4 N-terminal Bacteriophage T7-like domain-containing protein n=1 Tax=Photobacterium rosenbergii TaxID=294936 RepID=A0A2T3MYK6_9GAMM|nr:DUF3987 domain-containing protein [Photobacterium rosenbergii]PSW05049.1 hypothetical protein C9J01_27680 [Photobacterium rosenbergii]
MFVSDVSVAARGRWQSIFSSVGIDVPAQGKHSPCPICGGDDRFHFDDQDGRGTSYCRGCDKGRDGLTLVMDAKNISVTEAAKMVSEAMGQNTTSGALTVKQHGNQANAEAERLANSVVWGESDYLKSKGIDSGFHTLASNCTTMIAGMLFESGSLYLPVYSADNLDTLVGAQLINNKGEKAFLKGTKKKGSICQIKNGDDIKYVVIGEGLATVLTGSLLLGCDGIVAFDAGNLPVVASQIKKMYPSSCLVWLGDRDKNSKGYNKASEAAEIAGGIVLMPDFNQDQYGDWNDYHQLHGDDNTREKMISLLEQKESELKHDLDTKRCVISELDNDTNSYVVDITKHDEENLIFKLAKSIANAAKFPEQTTALCTLAIFSSAASSCYAVDYQDGEPLSIGLYVAAEQPAGTAKSRVIKTSRTPVQKEFYKATCKANEAIEEQAEQDENTGTHEPLTMFVTNATSASLDGLLRKNNGFFNIASAEQGAVSSVLGASHEGAGDNDVLLSAFTGTDYVNSLRASRDGYAGMPWGSITVLAQDGTINTILDKTGSQGIAERFLMLAEPSYIGKRDFSVSNSIDHALLDAYTSLVGDMATLNTALSPSSISELKRLQICLSGWECISDYRNNVEPLLADGQKYSHAILRGAFSKCDIQIMKIAALLHLASGKDDSVLIGGNTVKAAIGIVNELLLNLYNILEAKGIVGMKAEYIAILKVFDRQSQRTERQIIQSRGRVEPFSSLNNKSDAIRNAINEMISAGLLAKVKDGNGVHQIVPAS